MPATEFKEFGKKLRSLRDAARLSRGQLVEQAKISLALQEKEMIPEVVVLGSKPQLQILNSFIPELKLSHYILDCEGKQQDIAWNVKKGDNTKISFDGALTLIEIGRAVPSVELRSLLEKTLIRVRGINPAEAKKLNNIYNNAWNRAINPPEISAVERNPIEAPSVLLSVKARPEGNEIMGCVPDSKPENQPSQDVASPVPNLAATVQKPPLTVPVWRELNITERNFEGLGYLHGTLLAAVQGFLGWQSARGPVYNL